jgi:hypothetical protein
MSLDGDWDNSGLVSLRRWIPVVLCVTLAGCGSASHRPAAQTRTAGGGENQSTVATRAPNPPTLRLEKQIGPFSIGESYGRVQSEWGDGKNAGRACGNGVFDPDMQFTCKRYRVQGGDVWVGVASSEHRDFSHGRLVSLITTSPHYKTADGIGVGSHIPRGTKRRIGGVTLRYKVWANFPAAWWRDTSPPKPASAHCGGKPNVACWRWLRSGRETFLLVTKGVVTAIRIDRGDFWIT